MARRARLPRACIEAFEHRSSGRATPSHAGAAPTGSTPVTEPIGRFSRRPHDRPWPARRRRSLRHGLGVTLAARRWSAPPAGSSCRSSLQQAIDQRHQSADGEVQRRPRRHAGGHRRRRPGRRRCSPSARRSSASVARSEEALYDLRARLFDHIHRLSLADHNEERTGALVARVTSDIETLAQFFQWGGLAWLLDGTLMLIVAAVMLAYDWLLALVAFAVAAPLAFVLRAVQRHLVAAYDEARERNAEMLTDVTEVVAGRRDDARLRRRRGATPAQPSASSHRARRRPDPGRRRSARSCSPPARCSACSPSSAVVVVGVARRARRRADRRGAGRLHLPHLPVPRADRRVHRGARPDPDRRRRPAPGARRARHPDRPAADRAHPIPLPAGPLDVDIDARSTFAYRSRGPRRSTTGRCCSTSTCTSPPASRWRSSARPVRARPRSAGSIARFADPTVGDDAPRRRAAARASPTPSCASASWSCRRSRSCSTTRSPPTSAFARPGTVGTPTSSAVVDRLDLDDWLDTLPDGVDDARSASAASSCRPASASSSRCVRAVARRSGRAGARRGHVVGRRAHRGAHRPGARHSSPRAAPRSPSPTGCRPRRAPTGCSCSTTGGWSRTATHAELVDAGRHLRPDVRRLDAGDHRHVSAREAAVDAGKGRSGHCSFSISRRTSDQMRRSRGRNLTRCRRRRATVRSRR